MITAKRNAFRLQIRHTRIQSLFSKARYTITQANRQQALSRLIQQTQHEANKEQVAKLLHWVSLDQQNSILHLGNLLIDEVIPVQWVKQMSGELAYGENKYVIWLLRILYYKGYFGEVELVHLIKFVKACANEREDDDNILSQHGLPLLKAILKEHTAAIQLILQEATPLKKSERDNKEDSNNQNIFPSIFKLTASTSKNSKICYSIISRILATEGIADHFMKVVEIKQLIEICSLGMLRVESSIRSLCCQILTNLFLTLPHQHPHYNQWGIRMALMLLKRWIKQKQSVQIQISYFVVVMIQNLSSGSLQFLIHEASLMGELAAVLEEAELNNCLELRANCLECLKMLDQMQMKRIETN